MSNILQSGIYFIIISVHCFLLVSSKCDENYLGSTECVLLYPYYSRYQWATCLTDQYIRLSSKGKHVCLGGAAICYDQCMIELHELATGPVYDDCACNETDTYPTTPNTPKGSTLPPWCDSPGGTECNWYRQCLEARYPCKQTGNSYALDFGEKFCQLYDAHYNRFDPQGQKWIDAVRKCLQVKLVPLLRPFQHPTCEEIKNHAFKTHTDCYVRPSDGAQSVCDIGIKNMLRIIGTVYPALGQEFLRTSGQSLNVLGQCINVWTEPVFDSILRVTVDVKNFVGSVVDAADQTVEALNKFISLATRVINKLEELYGYVFPMGPRLFIKKRSINSASNMTFGILLLPRSEYDLNYNGPSGDVNVTHVMYSIVEMIESGSIRVDLPDDVMVQNVVQCDTFQCNQQIREVFIPVESTSAKPETEMNIQKYMKLIIIATASACGVVIVTTIVAVCCCRRKRNSGIV